MKLYSKTFKAMGTICEIKLYHDDEVSFNIVSDLLIREARRIESKYTRFKPDSITSEINRAAGTKKAVSVDDETVRLIHYANVLYAQSEGLFDITSGVLRQIWDFTSNKIPSEKQKRDIVNRIGWDKVNVNGNKISLSIKKMEIDFGGFVKEYTADRLATILLNNGLTHGLVNLGGDIRVVGAHPNGNPWTVGIQHPRVANRSLLKVDIFRGSIATSGDYERHMVVNGRRYSHLLSPFSGESISPYYASVSVISEQCLIAGSFSTLAMLKSQKDPDWITSQGVDFIAANQRMKIIKNVTKHENEIAS